MTLPRAVPILLRHLGAYAELAALDITSSSVHLKARIGSMLALSASMVFCVLAVSVAVVASFWDTPYRLASVYSLVGLSGVMTAATGVYARRVRTRQPRFFKAVRNEWTNDQAIFQRIVPKKGEGDCHT
jgi:hypothetical protein